MRPQEVQRTSRGGLGVQEVPPGAPGLDFVLPRGQFRFSFWSKFWYVLLYFGGHISALFFYAFLVLFGDHFGVILETFWCQNLNLKSVRFQRTSPGAPGHHHRVKKLDFHGSVV